MASSVKGWCKQPNPYHEGEPGDTSTFRPCRAAGGRGGCPPANPPRLDQMRSEEVSNQVGATANELSTDAPPLEVRVHHDLRHRGEEIPISEHSYAPDQAAVHACANVRRPLKGRRDAFLVV